MAQHFGQGAIPGENVRINYPADATKEAEEETTKDDLSRSLLSEFLQSVPSAKSSGADANKQFLLAAGEVGAPSSDQPRRVETVAYAQPADEPPPPGSNPGGQPRPGQDLPGQPPKRDSLADVIGGRAEQKIESLNINGTEVKVKSVVTAPDRSRIVVLNEDYGVNPAGTKITFYDAPIFPQGGRSQYGNVRAVAELPNGNKVFSKVSGNVIYDLAKPISIDGKDGGPTSKHFEEMPTGTQIWRTTGGTTIEKFAKDSLTTPRGKVERIELANGKLQYTTQDSKTFTVEEQGGKMVITDLENGKPTTQTITNAFAERFNPPYNHPFYGQVLSRTRQPGAIRLDLGMRGECTIYLEPKVYDDKRKTLSTIFDPKDQSTQSFLSDNSNVTTRAGTKNHDWVKIESMPDGTQTVSYKNGDSTTRYSNGDRTEKYKNGLATSLDEKVIEVQRIRDKNTYVLADGGKVELKLKSIDPLIKTTKDGTPQLMKEDSVKEHFEHGQPTSYGPAKALETRNNGDTTYWLADSKEYSKISLLGAPRNDFKGFVTYSNGTNRMIHANGKVLPTLTLSDNQVRGLLNGELKPTMIPNLTRFDYQLLFENKNPLGMSNTGPYGTPNVFDLLR